MKKLALIMLTSILAVSLTVGVTFAVDKLVVQDGVGTNVFTVDELGQVKSSVGSTVVSPNDYTYMQQMSHSDTSWKGGFFIAKRARGTEAASTAVAQGDVVFTFDAQAHDGTGYSRTGQIIGYVDGPVSTGIVPMRWNFITTDSSGSTLARLTIKGSGNVGIGINNPTHLIHLNGGAYSDGPTWVNASSRELKKDIVEVSAEEAIQTVESLKPVSFMYKEGNQDVHVGFIAEDVPEMVATPDRKGLESMDIAAVLTKVVQEQQKMLKAQQETMAQMQDKITTLETALQFKQDKQELAQQ